MAQIDISQKLNIDEKATIKIDDEHEFEVDCSAETMIVAEQKFSKGKNLKDYFEIIELFLGKEATDLIKKKKLTVTKINTLIIAIMALANEVTYEEMEGRFQEQVKE